MVTNKSVNRLFLIIVLFYVAASLAIGWLPFPKLPVYASLILSEALILIPALIYFRVKHISIGEVIPFRRIKFSVGILVVVCTYLMYPLLIVLNALTLFFVESGTADLLAVTQNGNFFISALLIACMPAFVEEFIFRGILFQTYKKSRMLPAILLSGFLFGCMHMNFNQFLYAFMLGIFMAFLIEATGSILSSIIAHFTINFTSVAMSYLLGFLSGTGDGTGLDGNPLLQETGNFLSSLDHENIMILAFGVAIWAIIAIGTTAGAAGVYIAISKISGRWEHIKTMFRIRNRGRLITASLLLAILIMVGIMVWSVL